MNLDSVENQLAGAGPSYQECSLFYLPGFLFLYPSHHHYPPLTAFLLFYIFVLCACMCVCAHVCMHACVHECMLCVQAQYICKYVHICVVMCVHACVSTHVFVPVEGRDCC